MTIGAIMTVAKKASQNWRELFKAVPKILAIEKFPFYSQAIVKSTFPVTTIETIDMIDDCFLILTSHEAHKNIFMKTG